MTLRVYAHAVHGGDARIAEELGRLLPLRLDAGQGEGQPLAAPRIWDRPEPVQDLVDLAPGASESLPRAGRSHTRSRGAASAVRDADARRSSSTKSESAETGIHRRGPFQVVE
jgi:hypothetical protein